MLRVQEVCQVRGEQQEIRVTQVQWELQGKRDIGESRDHKELRASKVMQGQQAQQVQEELQVLQVAKVKLATLVLLVAPEHLALQDQRVFKDILVQQVKGERQVLLAQEALLALQVLLVLQALKVTLVFLGLLAPQVWLQRESLDLRVLLDFLESMGLLDFQVLLDLLAHLVHLVRLFMRRVTLNQSSQSLSRVQCLHSLLQL